MTHMTLMMYLQGDRLDKLENIPNNLLNRCSAFRNLHYFLSAWKVELTDGFHCSSSSSSVFFSPPCSRYVVNCLFLFARGVKACAGRGWFASAAPSPKTWGREGVDADWVPWCDRHHMPDVTPRTHHKHRGCPSCRPAKKKSSFHLFWCFSCLFFPTVFNLSAASLRDQTFAIP